MRLAGPILIGYHGNPFSLPTLNYIGSNIEITALHLRQFTGPYCWVSYFIYGTCMHGIYG